MKNIVIDQKGCRLSYDRQLLLIHNNCFKRPISLPFGQIQSLTIASNVDISSNLLTKLAEQKIAVMVLPSGRTGRACVLQGDWHAGVTRRQQQYETLHLPSLIQYWANILIKIKIHQHKRLLLTLRQSTPFTSFKNTLPNNSNDTSFDDTLNRLDTTLSALAGTPHAIATIRGIEGNAAAVFFDAYRQFFEPKWHFNNRNRRPPKDPINALLSLGYTLLQGLCEQVLFAVGFDPYLGALHEVSYNRQSLACDFAELNRHRIEYWVWQLVNEGILTPKDFNFNPKSSNTTATPACQLLKSGRNAFYASFARLRPQLQKSIYKQAWCWLRRIEKPLAQQDNNNHEPNQSQLSQTSKSPQSTLLFTQSLLSQDTTPAQAIKPVLTVPDFAMPTSTSTDWVSPIDDIDKTAT